MKYQAARGTHDILPAEAARFHRLEQEARATFRQFGFHEIRTPTFESLGLFQRSLGETTDVVQKEIYAFEDRGGRKLALRPEGTAGVVRAFVEHHLSQTSPFCKVFYIGPMFRAERPQAGRYREFWQIGAEYFGNAAPAADADLLTLVHTLLRRLPLQDFQIQLNSLGCDICRPLYRRALLDFLAYERPHLCEDCSERIEKNPLRVLDCKKDGPRLSALPTMDGFWCDACRIHFKSVCALLEKVSVPFTLTPRLVRGLDYYTRTVFEVTTTLLGAQDALAAGGRYDKLVKELGGPDIPALGFALGSERTLAAGGQTPVAAEASTRPPAVFVAAVGEEVQVEAFHLLQQLRVDAALREAGISIEGGFFDKKAGAQLSLADKWGATHCVILGPDEIEKAEVTLRTLKTSSQERLPRANLVQRLQSL